MNGASYLTPEELEKVFARPEKSIYSEEDFEEWERQARIRLLESSRSPAFAGPSLYDFLMKGNISGIR